MGLSVLHFNVNGIFASGTNNVTVTVPANSLVAVLTSLNCNGALGYHAGTFSDTGGNSYLAAGAGGSNTGNQVCDAAFCLNTSASATSISYATNAAYAGNIFQCATSVWVISATGGAAIFGSQSNNVQSAPGTGTDAITSGSVTCAPGSIIVGVIFDNGPGPVSAGTGFTQSSATFVYSEYGLFNASQGATATTATGTDAPIMTQGVSFGLNSTTPSPLLPKFNLGIAGTMAPLGWIIRRRQIRAKERNAELRRWQRDDSSGLILPQYKKAA